MSRARIVAELLLAVALVLGANVFDVVPVTETPWLSPWDGSRCVCADEAGAPWASHGCGNKGGRTMRIVKPTRAAHTYRQRLRDSAERVFPLLCPVRETEWAVGWAPELVVSSTGLAERDCVFTTPEGNTKAVWYVTRHEPQSFFVEMLKITPEVTACRLDIQLVPDGAGCFADVAYCHTSLGPAGDRFVAEFTADSYRRFMQAWENELNHFLLTGRMS